MSNGYLWSAVLVSAAVTALFVVCATREFWYKFARAIYIAAIGLLALVLVIAILAPFLAKFFIFVENDKKFCAGLFRRL